MGRDGCRHRGAECLVWGSERGGGGRGPIPRALPVLLLLLVCSWVQTGSAQAPPPQCRIQKCTTDFVSLTTHLPPALVVVEAEFCAALRAYAACTQRTARTCRGNLVFHSALLGISDLMTQRNCSRDGPTSPSHPEIPLEPCNYHSRSQHVHVHTHVHGQAHVRSPPVFLFCGLFGDPHLRTFRDSFQTCKVEGAWPLVDNDYLSVQVTNVPVVTGSSATATNKITIIFKPFEACTDQRVYQAVSDHLPAAFVDGTISSGQPGHAPSGGGKLQALWILDRSPGRHVELHADYIGVTVIVRQVGRYLTLALRIPEELSRAYDADSQDLQLCVNGCPGGERIDRRGHLPLPRPPPPALGLQAGPAPGSQAPPPWAFSEEAAQQACAEQLNMRDIYYSSCVFDLLTTGDANFTAAALSAQKDMELLHPHRDRWRIFPRSGSAPGPAPQPITRLALLLLCALGSGLV